MLGRVSPATLFVLFVYSIPLDSNAQISEEYMDQLPPVAQKELRGCCSELLTGKSAGTRWGCSHYKVEDVCTAKELEEARQERDADGGEQRDTRGPTEGEDPTEGTSDGSSRSEGSSAQQSNKDPKERSSASKGCNDEERQRTEAEKKHKELSNNLNDRLLQLEDLRNEYNELVQSAQRSLGVALATHLIGLPANWGGNIYNVVQRFLGNEISDAALQNADRVMQKKRHLLNKIQHNKDQFVIIKAGVDKAQRDRERLAKLLNECREKHK